MGPNQCTIEGLPAPQNTARPLLRRRGDKQCRVVPPKYEFCKGDHLTEILSTYAQRDVTELFVFPHPVERLQGLLLMLDVFPLEAGHQGGLDHLSVVVLHPVEVMPASELRHLQSSPLF